MWLEPGPAHGLQKPLPPLILQFEEVELDMSGISLVQPLIPGGLKYLPYKGGEALFKDVLGRIAT